MQAKRDYFIGMRSHCICWLVDSYGCMTACLANVATIVGVIGQSTWLTTRRTFSFVTAMFYGMMTLGRDSYCK